MLLERANKNGKYNISTFTLRIRLITVQNMLPRPDIVADEQRIVYIGVLSNKHNS